MRKPVAVAAQIALLIIGYEIAMIPLWQYLIVIGIIMLVCLLAEELK